MLLRSATLLAVWVVAFFRDPERQGRRGERVILAPADGTVVSIVEVDEPTFFNERAVRISIFMNVFNCHVNRYPTDGTVSYRYYNPGKVRACRGREIESGQRAVFRRIDHCNRERSLSAKLRDWSPDES